MLSPSTSTVVMPLATRPLPREGRMLPRAGRRRHARRRARRGADARAGADLADRAGAVIGPTAAVLSMVLGTCHEGHVVLGRGGRPAAGVSAASLAVCAIALPLPACGTSS